jgi:peptidoglycan hydrolase-like protein with peptidoglycan-binding domain
MKRKNLSTAAAIFAAASIASGTAVAQTSDTKEKAETIRPDISAPGSSTGGTQSQRTQSGTPLPKGSPFSGTVEMGHANSAQGVKAAQQALQDKGHNPGPIDGMMGPRTREALKSFQTASGLETTGTLNEATAEKLGVDLGPSKGSNNMDSGKGSSR